MRPRQVTGMVKHANDDAGAIPAGWQMFERHDHDVEIPRQTAPMHLWASEYWMPGHWSLLPGQCDDLWSHQ